MRDEVGKRIQFTPGEVQRYFEEHKEDYSQPESVRLSEILIAVPAPADGSAPDDAALAAAKAKADDIEAKLHQGGDFAQLAKSFSEASTAAEGGDLGQYRRGALAKVLEDKTFALNTGQYNRPHSHQTGLHHSQGCATHSGRPSRLQDSGAGSGAELLYGQDGAGHPRLPDHHARAGLHRHQAWLRRHRRQPQQVGLPHLLRCIYAAAPKKRRRSSAPAIGKLRIRSARRVRKSWPLPTPPRLLRDQEERQPEQVREARQEGKNPLRPGSDQDTANAPNATTEDAGAVQQPAAATPEPVNPLETKERPTQKTRYNDRARVASTNPRPADSRLILRLPRRQTPQKLPIAKPRPPRSALAPIRRRKRKPKQRLPPGKRRAWPTKIRSRLKLHRIQAPRLQRPLRKLRLPQLRFHPRYATAALSRTEIHPAGLGFTPGPACFLSCRTGIACKNRKACLLRPLLFKHK